MAACKNCETTGLLVSDLIGDECVHCFGTETKQKNHPMECIKCGKISKSLTNGMCDSCFENWKFY